MTWQQLLARLEAYGVFIAELENGKRYLRRELEGEYYHIHLPAAFDENRVVTPFVLDNVCRALEIDPFDFDVPDPPSRD